MLSQTRNVFVCVIGLVLSAVTSSHAYDENALAKAKKVERIGAIFVCENCDLSGADMSGMYGALN